MILRFVLRECERESLRRENEHRTRALIQETPRPRMEQALRRLPSMVLLQNKETGPGLSAPSTRMVETFLYTSISQHLVKLKI